MGLPETQNPLQIVACKGSWDSLELGETIIWWRWGGIEPIRANLSPYPLD